MNIGSSLLNWLTKATTTPEVNPAAQAPAEKPQATSRPLQPATTDRVQFSELAQKLSQTPPADKSAQITLEERLALRQEPEPQTYKPSLMQMAKKFLGVGMS
ncbi:hypothetical protein SAMN05660860_01888 [Geoalkalibacter ferrihydriticus]|uniref:Uncharacterized protein n=2 Tax=Geoalkalibacter ferrihydriticus TaxID=392333 RepID=A0A0C2HK66_9BACT|nr:hypothetical protein [Geoalkalibacter ferrihydriticus]KIH77466.1 hypothetical protein GFER_01695 [Geoalkalibacter ferrihydriticus DSM 17813]SDM13884.1 hypothetical protein SAMN05660860_01888 [Geoalkalibacter ferrihydriticus]